MKRVRGFEKVSTVDDVVRPPERGTGKSAGYDFYAVKDITIQSSLVKFVESVKIYLRSGTPIDVKPTLVKTGIKAYMLEDEYLALYNRSSNPSKLGLVLANGVGVVDSDYYNNESNEGEIGFLFYNLLPWDITIHVGDKIGQGVFHKFYKADGDVQDHKREGGFGSTGA